VVTVAVSETETRETEDLRGAGLGGDEAPSSVAPTSQAASFRELAREVRSLGLLDRSPGYYVTKIAVNAASWILVWAVVFAVGDSWSQLLVAVGLGFVTGQTGFLAHDAGHLQVSGSRRATSLLGMIHLNLMCGLSFGWWVVKHNRHHGHPNLLGSDPDVMIDALAYTEEQARSKRGVYRLIARNQAYLLFPLLLLEAWHITVVGAWSLIRGKVSRPLWEMVLISVHFALLMGALFWLLSPLRAVAFLALYMGVAGLYLGLVFAPNHKGMPISKEGEEMDWLHRQILTARNVRGHPLTDFLYGGLNYQIEHHLFPTMPRNRLRRAQQVVRRFCERQGIAYHEVGPIGSFREVLKDLHRISASLRPR
jgi:fatty acid desaturase